MSERDLTQEKYNSFLRSYEIYNIDTYEKARKNSGVAGRTFPYPHAGKKLPEFFDFTKDWPGCRARPYPQSPYAGRQMPLPACVNITQMLSNYMTEYNKFQAEQEYLLAIKARKAMEEVSRAMEEAGWTQDDPSLDELWNQVQNYGKAGDIGWL